METFGEIVRNLREKSGYPLRKVAAELDLDPSTLSKIERNERSASRAHISKLSTLFGVDERELLVNYLSDRIAFELINEECSPEVLKVVPVKIKYIKQKLETQSAINF